VNKIDLNDRVAVITGGAQGIGFAAAQRMLRSGASVALWDIDAKRLHEAENALNALAASEKLSGRVSSEVVELSVEADIAAAMSASRLSSTTSLPARPASFSDSMSAFSAFSASCRRFASMSHSVTLAPERSMRCAAA